MKRTSPVWVIIGLLVVGAIIFRDLSRLRAADAVTHYNLGVTLRGKGDLDGAIAEYRTVLKMHPNLPEAHNNLGNALLRKGDLDGAIAEYREAAEQGVSEAQNNLAVLYAQGQGVPQDYVSAYMWFSIAAASKPDKNPAPANVQLLESHMVPEQVAEGKRRAEEWLKQHPAAH